MNALAFILQACMLSLAFGATGDYVVQVKGSCDEVCLKDLAKDAGKDCTAKSLGSSTKRTWVIGTCPSTDSMTAESSGRGWENIAYSAASKTHGVQKVEKDGEYRVNRELWNVDEVDGTPANDERCVKSKLGMGVLVAVLDTGCTPRVKGSEYFSAIKCRSYIEGEDSNTCTDVHTHGSHVAGTAVGGIHGVAPMADLACLKVLSDEGGGTMSGIITAINDVATYSRDNMNRKIILNLSLGGGKSETLNAACLDATKNSRIFMAVAAGNSGDNAKNYSPASAANSKRIFAVGAHGEDGKKASFSNYGTKVKISAPGVEILSTTPLGLEKYSGTSMASPHVAGAMAAIWSDRKWPNLDRLTGTATVSYPGGEVKKLTYCH